jgi:hypothetical protein
MNEQERRKYWSKAEKVRLKLERKYTELVEGAFNDQARSLIAAVTSGKLQDPAAVDFQVWDTKLMEIYRQLYTEAFTLAANSTYNSLIKLTRKFTGMGRAETWLLYVQDWLRQHGLQMVVTITGNSRALYLRIANEAIQEGLDQGLSAEDVTKLIVERLQDEGYTYARYRARRIARTETNRATNEGHMQGARALPFEVTKVWISAKDNRTRREPRDEWDHWVLDGAVVDYDIPFKARSRNGQEIEVRMAGDVEAPAGFTINCRCRVAFEGKRDQNGNLIMKPEDQLIAPVQR